ncbi:MAG: hypothetical protein RLZZ187_972 [Pseudomonadota bacterium]
MSAIFDPGVEAILARLAATPLDEYRDRREDEADVIGWQVERLDAAVAERRAARITANAVQNGKAAPQRDHDGGDADAAERHSQRDEIVEAVLATGALFWRDGTEDAFCTLPIGGRTMRFRVRSDGFKRIVRYLYGVQNMVAVRGGTGALRPSAASDNALREAVGALDAMALMGERRAHARPRTCFGRPGEIWLDLADESWRAVRVTRDGWTVVDGADVPLIRPSGLLALPTPEEGGTLDLLHQFFGRGGEDAFILSTAWLVAALYPRGPYPVLALDGEQGSGKTTFSRMLRALVDPNVADLAPLPRDERDAVIACSNGAVLGLDNLSNISPDMADVLCRIATGSGFRARRLYSDADEYIVRVCNPVLLNGIPALLARGDLADRALAITLPKMPDAKRAPEAALWREFEAARPKLLGLLLTALSQALRDMDTIQLGTLPRMADFARLACAAAPAFGWKAEDILGALDRNRAAAVQAVIDGDPVASAVASLVQQRAEQRPPPGPYEGTASDLLVALTEHIPEDRRRERDWPKDPTRLSQALRRCAPALRRAGIEVEQRRESNARKVRISGVTIRG